MHEGIDFANRTGTPVVAACAGKVTRAGRFGGYGITVDIAHIINITCPAASTRYAHLNLTHVKVGEEVQAGQRIGDMGSTGHSTGPHLHFETRWKGGGAFNPELLLNQAASAAAAPEAPKDAPPMTARQVSCVMERIKGKRTLVCTPDLILSRDAVLEGGFVIQGNRLHLEVNDEAKPDAFGGTVRERADLNPAPAVSATCHVYAKSVLCAWSLPAAADGRAQADIFLFDPPPGWRGFDCSIEGHSVLKPETPSIPFDKHARSSVAVYERGRRPLTCAMPSGTVTLPVNFI